MRFWLRLCGPASRLEAAPLPIWSQLAAARRMGWEEQQQKEKLSPKRHDFWKQVHWGLWKRQVLQRKKKKEKQGQECVSCLFSLSPVFLVLASRVRALVVQAPAFASLRISLSKVFLAKRRCGVDPLDSHAMRSTRGGTPRASCAPKGRSLGRPRSWGEGWAQRREAHSSAGRQAQQQGRSLAGGWVPEWQWQEWQQQGQEWQEKGQEQG